MRDSAEQNKRTLPHSIDRPGAPRRLPTAVFFSFLQQGYSLPLEGCGSARQTGCYCLDDPLELVAGCCRASVVCYVMAGGERTARSAAVQERINNPVLQSSCWTHNQLTTTQVKATPPSPLSSGTAVAWSKMKITVNCMHGSGQPQSTSLSMLSMWEITGRDGHYSATHRSHRRPEREGTRPTSTLRGARRSSWRWWKRVHKPKKKNGVACSRGGTSMSSCNYSRHTHKTVHCRGPNQTICCLRAGLGLDCLGVRTWGGTEGLRESE